MAQTRNNENKITERSFFDYLPKDKLAEIVKMIPTISLSAGFGHFPAG